MKYLFWSAAVAGWLVAALWLTERIVTRPRLQRENFKGDVVPVGWGLFIALSAIPGYFVAAERVSGRYIESIAYAVIVGGFALLGLIDDLFGDRLATGLRGHFKQLAHGQITTGLIKAIGGALLSMIVAYGILGRAWPDALVDGAVIALCANALNLFDLRPGRACALFLIAAIGITLWGSAAGSVVPLLVVVLVPASLVYFPDRRGRVMLGDTGSNLLGGALGLALVLALSAVWARVMALALLICLHILAERVSLSVLIEQTPLLRRVDRLTGVR